MVPSGTDRAIFAVHAEGPAVFGLYLAPFRFADVAAAFEHLGIPGFFEISPQWGVRAGQPTPLARLAERTGAYELVDASAAEAPDSVMADPDAALANRSVALAVSHDGHAIVYSRGGDLLRDVLTSWVSARLRHAGSESLPDAALRSLVDPLPDEAWHEMRLERHRRFDVLCIETRAADAEGPATVHEERWVGGGGRAWRGGWSW